jgi:hypothetical protein
MRFNKYITEENDIEFEKIYDILKKDCFKFLKESKGLVLYRGTERGASARIEKKNVRKDRLPLDMPPTLHEVFNEELHKKFHWYPRTQGVFATSNPSEASAFGIGNFFFPIGNYKYIWSPSYKDIWLSLKKHFPEIYSSQDDVSGKYKNEYIDWIKKAAATYISNKLYDALVAGHEISFKCDSYYLVKEYYGYGVYFSQKYAEEIRK